MPILTDLWNHYMNETIVRSATEHDLTEVLNLYRHLHPDEPQLETGTVERVWSTLLTSSFMTVIVAQAAELLADPGECELCAIHDLRSVMPRCRASQGQIPLGRYFTIASRAMP